MLSVLEGDFNRFFYFRSATAASQTKLKLNCRARKKSWWRRSETTATKSKLSILVTRAGPINNSRKMCRRDNIALPRSFWVLDTTSLATCGPWLASSSSSWRAICCLSPRTVVTTRRTTVSCAQVLHPRRSGLETLKCCSFNYIQ